MTTLRKYQQDTLDKLFVWWQQHTATTDNPLIVVPTGGGKSVIVAELVRSLFDTYSDHHPRTIVLVPSKELAEQNAEKIHAFLPTHISVGYYSASLGRKRPDADVIVATIGSIYKDAHLLGNIRCVIIDEAHLVSTNGKESGRYRQFLTELAKYCRFRVVGYTATPFQGNGVWLTEGEAPLFTGVAHTVKMGELLEAGFLSPLVRPVDVIKTQIDTTGISTTSGDYNVSELSERVEEYLEAASIEAAALAADRKKWISFCATVANAQHFKALLEDQGITAAVVTGDVDKTERAALIADFRAGKIRCLITVMALATGFDVPDVDCIIWLRPTKSPVLYVQGFGRGTRIAPGKQDCLVLDFTDTVERLGPIDTIKGRSKRKSKNEEQGAPHRTCPECGEQAPIVAVECPSCGYEFPPTPPLETRAASNAAILSSQIAPKIKTYEVHNVTYALHRKADKPDSMRVDYWHGLRVVVSEWVCLWHPPGFAQEKGRIWWARRTPDPQHGTPKTAQQAVEYLQQAPDYLKRPHAVIVNHASKWPELASVKWEAPEPVTTTEGEPA